MAYNPPQTPLDRLAFSITNTHGLDPQTQAAVIAWLRGAPLTDPKAIKYVQNFFPDMTNIQVPTGSSYKPGPVVGATPQQTPAPAAAVPAPTSASTPPGVGGGQATGAQAAGGMYQNYIANQRAAASRPIAENPTKGINAGGVTGAEMTPPPPVTAATAPNAVNPTAPNPASSSTGGSVMANPVPVTPAGNPNDLNFVQGSNLVGANAQADVQLREALRAAGYDPSNLGLGGQYFAKLIQPTLAAEASLYGYGNAAGADVTKGRDFVANLVRSFITPGVNAAAQAAQYAQGIAGNPAFQQTIGDLPNDQQRQQVLQNIASLMYGNKSALEQSAAAANFDRGLSAYQDAGAGFSGPNADQRFTGNFSQWLTQTPEGQRLARMIGLGG